MGVVDVARQKNAGVHFTPVSTHLLAVLFASIEIGYFIRTEDIVHVLGQLCLQRTHHRKFLTHEDLCQQVLSTREDHRLLVEVLNERTLRKELRHVIDVMSGLFGKHSTCSRKNRRAYKDRYVRQILD